MLKSTRVISGVVRALKPLQLGSLRTGGVRTALTRGFASNKKPDLDEIVIEADSVSRSETSTYEFQAETRKLLNIVAKSIYTDSEVFLRELLSNASDALEKQKFKSFEDSSQEEGDPLQVTVITNEAKRQLTIFDTGIGMSKQELIENLGTIAKSGSKSFVDKLKDSGKPNADIIGQFGVGFYSSFIVGHTIEVISKQAGKDAHIWVSDGSGQFSVSKAENVNFDRGTKIVIHLNPDHLQFCRKLEVEQIIKKYSNFINYPIFLNGEKVNITAPIWTRDKGSVQEMEYRALYEHLSKSKLPYKYKLHFAAEVPIQMKAVLFIPTTHSEKQGQGREEPSVALYSRKVLIKDRCAELLPSYLRFVKGVVDCEDLPLNISRENYQDSALIAKIRGILTKRILKMLHDEMARDPAAYKEWVRDFTTFFGEGFLSDKENSEFLIKLLRFKSSFSDDVTIDDYVASAKPGQTNIYFTVAADLQSALKNPFMEGFVQSKTPVLLLQSKIEEIFVSQLEKYKGFKVVSIESNYEDIQKDIGVTSNSEAKGLSEEEISGFCIWVKNELQPVVSQVKVSKRLTKDPAIIISQVPSSMKAYIQLMEPAQLEALKTNHTMEVNPNHKLIVALNKLRKQDLSAANQQLRYLLDNTLLASGLLIETSEFVHKTNNFMESRINSILEQKQLKEANATAERPVTGQVKEGSKEALLKEVYGEMRNDLRENMREAQAASQDKN